MLIDRLRTMATNSVSFDTETYLIRPGNLQPPLVLGSVSWYDQHAIQGELLSKEQVLELFAQIIEDLEKVICGANISYDLAVLVKEFAKRGVDILPYIFHALMGEHTEHMTGIHDGRIFDIQHAQALDAIARGNLGKDPRSGAPLKGRYSQEQVIKLLFDRDDAKVNDEYRLRYGEFDNVPLDQLPPSAAQYPIDDTNNCHEAALAQVGVLPKIAAWHSWGTDGLCTACGGSSMSAPCWITEPHLNLHDLASQTATAFCLHMGASWGFKVDQTLVDVIETHSTNNREDGLKPYQEANLIRENGTENRSELKRLVALAYGSEGKCETCQGTGKVPSQANPKSKVICFRISEDGVTKEKTCDGTGLVLSEDVPRSEKEGIGYGRSFLIESGDEFLMNYAEVLEDSKTLNVYVPYLRTGRLCISCNKHGTVKDPHDEGCVVAGWKDIPLTLRPNPILDTGRVSYDGAIMLLPRKQAFINKAGTYVPSLRECFVPRSSEYVFSSEDFDNGEMFAHAQSCTWLLGYSDLGRALLNGVDPHSALAATTLGVGYEEFLKRKKEPLFKAARQASKPFNFGRPTGMSAVKIVLSQRAQGPDTPCEQGPSWIDDGTNTGHKIKGYKGLRFCILMNGSPTCGGFGKMVKRWGKQDRPIPPTCRDCLECAEMLANKWLTQWTENQPYFNLVGKYVDDGMPITEAMLERWPHLKKIYWAGIQLEPGQIMQHWSGRLRGGLEYCSLANGFFQGLLGDIAKLAYRLVARECYDKTVKVPKQMFEKSEISLFAGAPSPLLGAKPTLFAHDEIVAEHHHSVAAEGATRISEIMRDCVRYICPDVAKTAGAKPTLMPAWFKGAEEVRDDNGKLILWQPKLRKT